MHFADFRESRPFSGEARRSRRFTWVIQVEIGDPTSKMKISITHVSISYLFIPFKNVLAT